MESRRNRNTLVTTAVWGIFKKHNSDSYIEISNSSESGLEPRGYVYAQHPTFSQLFSGFLTILYNWSQHKVRYNWLIAYIKLISIHKIIENNVKLTF